MITTDNELREHALQCAKNFKTSWRDLGRVLYTIWKDKQYKDWGFATFEGYVTKEINIRKMTAQKLLRSYFFLEKEEPQYLKEEYTDNTPVSSLPSFEAVDVLRLAKNKKLSGFDYNNLKKNVFDKGKDVREIKKDLTALIRQREEYSPEEAIERKREGQLKRLLGTLKSIKNEIESSRILPSSILREVSGLIKQIEDIIKK